MDTQCHQLRVGHFVGFGCVLHRSEAHYTRNRYDRDKRINLLIRISDICLNKFLLTMCA